MGSRGRVGRSATVISLDIRSSLGFRIGLDVTTSQVKPGREMDRSTNG